jgi:hypothetical protein
MKRLPAPVSRSALELQNNALSSATNEAQYSDVVVPRFYPVPSPINSSDLASAKFWFRKWPGIVSNAAWIINRKGWGLRTNRVALKRASDFGIYKTNLYLCSRVISKSLKPHSRSAVNNANQNGTKRIANCRIRTALDHSLSRDSIRLALISGDNKNTSMQQQKALYTSV